MILLQKIRPGKCCMRQRNVLLCFFLKAMSAAGAGDRGSSGKEAEYLFCCLGIFCLSSFSFFSFF